MIPSAAKSQMADIRLASFQRDDSFWPRDSVSFSHHENLVSHNNSFTGWSNTHPLDGTSIPPPVPSWLFVTGGQSSVLCGERLRQRKRTVSEPGAGAKHDLGLCSLKVTSIKKKESVSLAIMCLFIFIHD